PFDPLRARPPASVIATPVRIDRRAVLSHTWRPPRVTSSAVRAAARGLRSAAGPVQRNGAGQALQLNQPNVDEPYGWDPGGPDDAVADQDLAGPGMSGDPRGGVDRPAEVVAVLQDHRAGIDARMGRRK